MIGIDITDKHRLLITAIRTTKIAIQGVVDIQSFFSNDLFARGFPPRGPLKDGDVLLVVTREQRTTEYKDPEFTFNDDLPL
jgi:hypothetical protein